MQILERLIRLSCKKALPIPFTHRIPLSLLDGTTVHVGVTAAKDRVGDIVVSVLDLARSREGRDLPGLGPERRPARPHR